MQTVVSDGEEGSLRVVNSEGKQKTIYGGLHQKSCTCAKTLGMLGIFEISTKTLYSLIF